MNKNHWAIKILPNYTNEKIISKVYDKTCGDKDDKRKREKHIWQIWQITSRFALMDVSTRKRKTCLAPTGIPSWREIYRQKRDFLILGISRKNTDISLYTSQWALRTHNHCEMGDVAQRDIVRNIYAIAQWWWQIWGAWWWWWQWQMWGHAVRVSWANMNPSVTPLKYLSTVPWWSIFQYWWSNRILISIFWFFFKNQNIVFLSDIMIASTDQIWFK